MALQAALLISSVFYMLWTIKVWNGSLFFLWTDNKCKIKKPFQYLQVLWWNEKQTCVHCNFLFLFKRKVHYPCKWIQLIEWSNFFNMNSCLHLSNKSKECRKFMGIRFWNLCFMSMKEFVSSKFLHKYFQEFC